VSAWLRLDDSDQLDRREREDKAGGRQTARMVSGQNSVAKRFPVLTSKIVAIRSADDGSATLSLLSQVRNPGVQPAGR
jgi:hypothetical protein